MHLLSFGVDKRWLEESSNRMTRRELPTSLQMAVMIEYLEVAPEDSGRILLIEYRAHGLVGYSEPS